jgi:hypothetical protein
VATLEREMDTPSLVELWRLYSELNTDHARSIVRAIELELHHRPVIARMKAGYPK